MIDNKPVVSRVAVSYFFFANGFLYANWTARLPELQRYFGINDAKLGALLFCIALGSITAMPIAGWLGAKYGSSKISGIFSALFCLSIPMVVFSTDPWVIRIWFFMLGVCSGSMDVLINSQAVLVERQWGSIIFSSFHAVFSIGMAIGAAVGGLFSDGRIPLQKHLWLMAIVIIIGVIWASFYTVKDTHSASNATAQKERTNKLLLLKVLLPFSIIAFCCMTGEGAMIDWSALYMNKIVGQNEAMSAWAFSVFGLSMTLGRIFGDGFISKYGKYNVLIVNAIFATLGMIVLLSVVAVWSTFVGLFLVGLGLSTVVPIVYSSAGNVKNISSATGISVVSSIGYTGFFIGPPTIGFLSETMNLRFALGFVLVLMVLMSVLIFTQKRRIG